MNMEAPRTIGSGNEFANEYMSKIHAQGEIIKDAEGLLGTIRYSSSLKPEAVSKVIKIQEGRIAAARAEIKRLQDENEEKITRHYKKAA